MQVKSHGERFVVSVQRGSAMETHEVHIKCDTHEHMPRGRPLYILYVWNRRVGTELMMVRFTQIESLIDAATDVGRSKALLARAIHEREGLGFGPNTEVSLRWVSHCVCCAGGHR